MHPRRLPFAFSIVVLFFVLSLAGPAHAASPDFGSNFVDGLMDWMQAVIAPGAILIGIIITAASWLGGGARQGMMSGFGVIISGVLLYGGPAVIQFIQGMAQ